jgi:hypothetical protein
MKSLIVHKPLGAKLSKEIIANCESNNGVTCGVVYYNKKENTVKDEICDNLTELTALTDKICDENHEVFIHFGGKYPAKDCQMPYQKSRSDKYFFYFHAGEIKSIAYQTPSNEELTLWEHILAPLSYHGMITIIGELAKGNNGEFLVFTNTHKQGVQRFGKWEEVDGVWFSNDSYKKKAYVAPTYNNNQQSHSNLPSHYTKDLTFETKKYKIGGLTLTAVGEGMRKYFDNLEPEVGFYVTDIDPDYKNPGFEPMDFIRSINGQSYDNEDKMQKLSEKIGKKFNFHVLIWRIDSLEWSRGNRLIKKSHLTLSHKKKSDGDDDYFWTPGSTPMVLNEKQKHFIVIKLSEDDAGKNTHQIKDIRLKYLCMSDGELITLAEGKCLGWQAIIDD